MNTRPKYAAYNDGSARELADGIGMIQCGREVTPNLNRLTEKNPTPFYRALMTSALFVFRPHCSCNRYLSY